MTARLVILYGHPDDPEAFEDYYAGTHIPYASAHMPNVRDAQNARVVANADGSPAQLYRISHLVYDDVASLRQGLATEDGRSTIDDLRNFATGGATVLVVDDD